MIFDLPQLEQTVSSLASYLLVVPSNHPHYIVLDRGNGQNRQATLRRIRLTQQFSSALLALGLTPDSDELQRIARWFDTPFPWGKHNEIDQIEMTRLEGLLNLQPEKRSSLLPRLEQLIQQRTASGYFDILHEGQSSGDPAFNTLWAISMVLLASQKGVTEGYLLPLGEMQGLLDRLINSDLEDKDLALALRLYYTLCGQLEADHIQRLEELLLNGERYKYFWGFSKQPYKWDRIGSLIQGLPDTPIIASAIGDNVRVFREIIQNTCYVIENLALLMEYRSDIEPVLLHSINLWWKQFEGDDAPTTLRSLFNEEYDFLLVLFRTLITWNAFSRRPIGEQFWQHLLRKSATTWEQKQAWEGKKSAEQALRNWIGIDIPENGVEWLRFGLSDASVIRIKPQVFAPGDRTRANLYPRSLIVKYGPKEEIDLERQNYKGLPAALQQMFVDIPRETYINPDGIAYVIMEDLEMYQTLYEVYPDLLHANPDRLVNQLGNFLLQMHRGGSMQGNRSRGNHLREIYFMPLFEHCNRVISHLNDHPDLCKKLPADPQEIDQQIDDLTAGILQHTHRLQGFPLSCQHGDLHTRNIMVQVHWYGGPRSHDFDLEFRLIDLESVRRDGDAAYDAGELLVDLMLVGERDQHVSRVNVDPLRLQQLQQGIQQFYKRYAQEREDHTFEVRLGLAKARAIMRVAKSFSKRSASELNQSHRKAADYARQSLNHAHQAVGYLQEVYEQLNQ